VVPSPLDSGTNGLLPPRKVDVRLPGKGNSNSHGAMPVHLIITMIKWIRTSTLSIKNSLSASPRLPNTTAAAGREGNNLKRMKHLQGCTGFSPESGASQGQNQVLPVLFSQNLALTVLSSLDCLSYFLKPRPESSLDCLTPRPESSFDCLIIFARQLKASDVGPSHPNRDTLFFVITRQPRVE